MEVLFAILASSRSMSPLGLILVFGVGVLLFILGFRSFREYRLLTDTPVIPIRSMPMGLVHVHGAAVGDDKLTSPLTGRECYYYRLRVERYEQQGKHSGWATVRDDRDQRNFYLDDGTGKVLVDPQRAELDVLQTFQGEFGRQSKRRRAADPSLNIATMSEEDLQAFVEQRLSRPMPAQSGGAPAAQHGIHVTFTPTGAVFSSDHSYRVTESCLLAGRECNIWGTCVENPDASDASGRNLIHRGENEKTYLITTQTERQEEKRLRNQSLLLILLGVGVMVFAAALAIFGGNK